MNDHEKDRIAAAFNQLRPDWPTKSIRTLLDRSELADRPRRDVTVALGWVACEQNTHTPARVLEAGPWWRAAGVDGAQVNHPERLDREDRCAVCGKSRDRCEAGAVLSEHDFAPDYRADRGAPRPAELTTTIPVRGAEQEESTDA